MDSILECEYTASITSFVVDIPRQPVVEINVMNNGKQALVDANVKLCKNVICRCHNCGAAGAPKYD